MDIADARVETQDFASLRTPNGHTRMVFTLNSPENSVDLGSLLP